MSKYKKTYKLYTAWNYEQEVEELNAASKMGWHLVNGGILSHEYEYDEDKCFRYQLDYQPGLSESERYVEIYQEQGWKLINKTFNGWYYFSKEYDPALPEEQYLIYTDKDSLKEMRSRWTKLAIVVMFLWTLLLIPRVISLVLKPTLPGLIFALVGLFVIGVFAYGIRIMRNPNRRAKSGRDCIFALFFFAIMILGLLGAFQLEDVRPNGEKGFGSMGDAPAVFLEQEKVLINTISVLYPDFYYLDVQIQSEQPFTFLILNEDNEEVYKTTSADFKMDGMRFTLSRGEYRIFLVDYTGGEVTYSVY